jgi:hypothetical protein
MAHYHLHVKAGPKGVGAEHAQYIERGGRFKAEKYGEIGESERGNLPEWARGSAARFFAAADEHERANGNSYREFELALPLELSDAARGQLVREFVAEQIGDKHAYVWAIHEPNGHNPHVHVMFSERIRDGLERGPEQYFKRANAKTPERGGHLKSDRFTSREGPKEVEALRARWAEVQNAALERAGFEVRVDHRSLEAQGIEREATRHRGPAVSGIEARAEVAEVTVRREAERTLRHEERREVAAEIRHVTREEVAAERVAARERRVLAAEVTGEERVLVLPLVEADRREQLGRAQAMAERRVERRQGLSMGGEIKETLLTQARALRERIGQQLGRVKEWVKERFPAPFERLKERSRDLLDTVVEKAQRALGRDAGQEQAADKTATPKRGMFDGLNLKAGARHREREAFTEVRLSAAERAPETAQQASQNLHRALDRYARAWSDAMRMADKNLPILEHQRTAFREASLALDGVQPGASADLHNSLTHEPKFYQAMTGLQGKERTAQLRAALDHEARVRTDPNLKAERLVKTWRVLEAERERTSGYDNKDAREQVKERMRSIAGELKRDPQLESILQRRAQELGIERGSRLDRVLKAPTIEQALSLSVRDLGRHRDRGLSL